MRKSLLFCFTSAMLLSSGSANGQYYGGIPMGRELLPACYDPNYPQDERTRDKVVFYSNQAIDKYLGLARSAAKLDKMFTGTREHRLMFIDGQQVDPQTARDPWVGRVAKVEPIGFVQSNERLNVHAQWRALGADQTQIGIYDAFIRAGIGGMHFRQLKLISTGSSAQPDKLESFCVDPGDIEKWQAAKAKRDAEKAAKAAVQN